MMVVGFAAASRGNAAEAAGAFGVYLQPPEATTFDAAGVTDIQSLVGGRHFAVVEDASALEAAVAAEHPQSIWIHRSALPSVTPAWLRSQLTDGTVIVGIDTSRGELASVLRIDGGSTPDWNPPQFSTFVAVGQALNVPYTNHLGEPATRSSVTIANDGFDPHDPAYLVAMIERIIGDVRETYGGSR